MLVLVGCMTGRRRGASTSFDSEPERTFLRLRREAREKRVVGAEEEEEHFVEYFEPNMEENMENLKTKLTTMAEEDEQIMLGRIEEF